MPSPRTFIIHEYDVKSSLYAYRSGDWKISWGAIAKGPGYGYIADVDYPHARCTALLPPTTGAATEDSRASEAQQLHLPPWGWQSTPDLKNMTGGQEEDEASVVAGPPPPFPQPGCCKTANAPCLFNIVS